VKTNLVLFGFMGSGKSSVGKLAAASLGLQFVDMDHVLEEKNGCTIEEIFSVQGEAYFREIESRLVEELSKQDGLLISTGGGVVLKEQNIQNFAAKGFLVHLEVDPETAFQRTRGSKRPLLKTADPLATIRELMKLRSPLYRSIPNKINTSNRSVQDVSAELIQLYQKSNL
jgi:shikimate kinase